VLLQIVLACCAAHKGLLFLDEIGELGLDEQAMLLKAVEEKRFLPVGGDHEVQSDFLLIAGTNRDLAREVAAGRFRETCLRGLICGPMSCRAW
jgi:transcriptional regulatory protein RtcR